MLLVIHIVSALASLVVATVAIAIPSRAKLTLSYGLIITTLTSGTCLVWTTHASLVSSCTTGLVYFAVVASLAAVARRRLFN